MAGALTSPPLEGVGLRIAGPAAIQASEDAREAAELERLRQLRAPVNRLGEHVAASYEAANSHFKKFIDNRLTVCERLRRGEYAPDIAAQIAEMGGSDLYFNITDPKVSAFVAWVLDVLLPTQEKSWGLEHTPIPDLPDSKRGQVSDRVIAGYRGVQQETGQSLSPEEVRDLAYQIYDALLDEETKEAKTRAARMEDIISDQLVEGGFIRAMSEFLDDFATYPSAILKGPTVRPVQRMAWQDGELIDRTEFIPCWSAVSPTRFKPSPNSRTVNEGYICEDIELDVRELQRLRGMSEQGYDRAAIDGVLDDLARGDHGPDVMINTPGNSARAQMESKDTLLHGGSSPTSVRGIEYWGPAQGSMLREWGLEVAEDTTWYEIQCIQVGRWVIKAMLNPDKLGRRPYSVASFRRVNRSIWGQALVELMEDCQRMSNGAGRALINNLALASGPIGSVDIDALVEGEDPTDIQPWRMFQYHGTKVNGARKPVDFQFVPAMVKELMEILEFSEDKAADRTNVPRYTHGQENIGGAGETKGGLEMLMGAATKGLKLIIYRLHIYVLTESLQRLYTWNLQYHPDDAAKGDCRIMPRGVLKVLMQDAQQVRRQQFLNDSNNPTDQQIITLRARARLWRAIADDLDLPTDEIVDLEEVDARLDMMAQQAQAQGMEGVGNAPNGAGGASDAA